MTQVDTPVAVNATISRSVKVGRGIPPWALIVIAVISVQFGAAIAKQLFVTAGPTGVVFLRTLIGSVIFLMLWRPVLRDFRKRQAGLIVLYGINIAVMMLVFYAAIERIPLGITVAISFAGPLTLAVIGSRRRIDLMWAGLAAVGILLLSPFANVDLDPVGILLSFVSATSWAMYILLSKRVSQRFPGFSPLGVAMGIATLVALPFGFSGALRVLADPGLLVLTVLVALLSSALPFAFEYQAMRVLRPSVVGVLLALEPVMATVVGFTLLSEALGGRELVGVVMVTVAAVATARGAEEEAPVPPEAAAPVG